MSINNNTLVSQKEVIIQIRFVDQKKDVADPAYVQFRSVKKLEHDVPIQNRMFNAEQVSYLYDFEVNLIEGNKPKNIVTKNNLKDKEITFKGLRLSKIQDYTVDTQSNDFPSQYITVKDGNTIALENIHLLLDESAKNNSQKYFDEDKIISIPYKKIVQTSFLPNSRQQSIIQRKKIDTVVKISNDFRQSKVLDTVDKWDPFINNLFWLLIAQVKEQYGNIIHLQGDKVQEELGYRRVISHQEFVNKIQNGLNTISRLIISGTDENGRDFKETAYLFNRSRVYLDNFEIEVQVNENYFDFFNNLTSWTKFALPQYIALKSVYSKKLFRLLKQYRTFGRDISLSIEELRILFNLSDNYKTKDINNGIIKLVMQELAPYFQQLNLTYGRTGRRITEYKFSFVKENNYTIDAPGEPNTVLDDIIGVGNIRSNPWLDKKMKYKAIDRFRKKRLGTTSRLVKAQRNNSSRLDSYFLDKKAKEGNLFSRDGLKGIENLGITQFRLIVNAYEIYNIQGRLTDSDIRDLNQMEEILGTKCIKEMNRTRYFKKPFKPNGNTIIERLLQQAFGNRPIDDEYLDFAIKRVKQISYIDAGTEIASEYATDVNRAYTIRRA